MNATGTCTNCGAVLPKDALNTVCPVCALQGVLGEAEVRPEPTRSLRSFGDYELLEEIARGGMGVVYKARQLSLGRIVAVKMLLFGAQARPEDLKRFRLEASTAAGLQHPNIVAIHEVGVHDDQPYLVMDFVDGPTLADLIVTQPLPAFQAAGYLKTIAEAIEYAHEHGILHRDLKPSNVLIDPFDQPRVTDFGLAKRLTDSQFLTPNPRLTLTGQLIGSPNYMAPEQAAAKPSRVGRATDVYALGALLYHLVTGRPPFTGESLAETLKQVIEAEPPSPGLINPGVPRDLETICLKCLEKEPRRRYQTAQALAEELGRLLRREPILARPAGPLEKAWRWCQRRPTIASLAGVTSLLLLTVLIGSPIAAFRINNARAAEQTARRFAQAESYTADMNLVLQAWEEGNLRRAQELLRKHVPNPGEDDLRGFEWRYLWKLCRDESYLTMTNPPGKQIGFVEGSRKNNLVLACGKREARLLAGDTGRELDRFIEPDLHREISASAWSPVQTNIVATGDSKGSMSLWDLRTKRVLSSVQAHTKAVLALAFSPDGRFLASTDAGDVGGGTLKLWDVPPTADASLDALWTNRLEHFCPTLLFSPDGRTLVSAGKEENEGRLAAWDANTGHALAPFPKQHIGYVLCMAFSPDGKFLAASGLQPTIFIWDFATRRVATELPGHVGEVYCLAFYSDGRRLVSGGEDNTIRIWDISAKRQIKLLRGHRADVRSVALSEDESSIFSASGDEIKVWKTVSQDPTQFLETHQSWVMPEWSPDGKWLVTSEYQHPNTIKVWNFATRQFSFDLFTFPENASGLWFSPDSALLAAGCEDRNVYVWATAGWGQQTTPPRPVVILTNEFEPHGIRFSPDGKILAFNGTIMAPSREPSQALNRVAFLEVGTWKKLDILPRAGEAKSLESAVCSLAFSDDGQTLGIGYKDGWVRLWDYKRNQFLSEFKDHDAGLGYYIGIFFSKDGHLLSTWSLNDSKVVLHDIHDLRHPVKVASWTCNHVGTMWEALLDPASRTLVSSGNDGRIKFWNLLTHQVALTLKTGEGPGGFFGFTSDDNLMVSWDAHGTLKFWPAASAAEIPTSKNAHAGMAP